MKIITYLTITMLICALLTGCGKDTCESDTNWPLKEVNTIYDQYGNLLQQILFNEDTGEYFIKEYTWTLRDDKWICVNQKSYTSNNYAGNNNKLNDTNSSITVCSDTQVPEMILNTHNIKVYIVEVLDKASWWEFGYKFKVENNSNKVLTIMFDDVSILGIDCKPMFFVDHIEPGHTAYFNLAWDIDTLKRSCIPYLDNVEFTLKIYDTENWNTPALCGTKVLLKHG